MLLRMLVVISVASLILFGLHYYVYDRLVRYLSLGPTEQRALKLTLGTLYALLWLAMPFSRILRLQVARPVMFGVFIWLGVLVMFSIALFGGDLARWTLALIERVRPTPTDPTRRAFLERTLGFVTLGLGGVLTGYSLFEGLRRVAVKRVSVSLSRLPQSLSGFRIVQVTDLHVGPTIDGRWLQQVVDQINALSPDAVAITGDLIDAPVSVLREHVAPLQGLKAAHGVYFVTGNHEYYSGPDEWIAELGRLGVRVLRNERVTVRKGDAAIDIAGIDDHHSGSHPGHGPDLPRAMAQRDPQRPVVLLAHQPIAVHEAAAHGVDLQLSGHTHGGQIWPWRYLVRLQQPFIAGLHRIQSTMLYVSCGTGYWGPPMRLGAPAEITELTLVS